MWERTKTILAGSLERSFESVLAVLPGLMAMTLVMALSLVAALAVRLGVRRALTGLSFDRRCRQWGFEGLLDWSPGGSPTALLSRLGFWLVLLLGAGLALGALGGATAEVMARKLIYWLPNVAAAGVIFVVGLFAARFLERGVLVSAVNLHVRSGRLLALGARWLVVVLAAAMALEHVGIGGTILTLSFGILFGGIVLALALAVGLGSREAVSRTWERRARESEPRPDEEPEEEVRHL
ncbi:MAG TPA: hypothetical protein VFR85_06790 [Anaeromyxobacteraceae bacterium]|nr:hypothetical protein [Anaeromyxobacteraceae bacterium]